MYSTARCKFFSSRTEMDVSSAASGISSGDDLDASTSPLDPQILLPYIDGEVLLFNLDDVKKLRTLGILGTAIGSLAAAPQQNNYLGLPIKLSKFEVTWLLLNHHAVLVRKNYLASGGNSPDASNNGNYLITPYSETIDADGYAIIPTEQFVESLSPGFKSEYLTFHTLRASGFYLLPGLKFGGQFLAYPGDPLRYHSHLIVNTTNEISPMEMVVGGRLATGVKKVWVICERKSNDNLNDEPGMNFSIEWSGFG